MSKVDRSSYRYADARAQALKIADTEKEFQVQTVFAAIRWRIGWIHVPVKEVMLYASEVVYDLEEEGELEMVPEYGGGLYVFRRAGVLDRIVAAVEEAERGD